jgi:hypothetical protein
MAISKIRKFVSFGMFDFMNGFPQEQNNNLTTYTPSFFIYIFMTTVLSRKRK